MTFFNKKEEVIDIELTQYGKHLLSIGKWKPAYYEFFDDDVIYDNQYAGLEDELQRDIQNRIKETPRPHVQYNFVSSQEDIKKIRNQISSNKNGAFSDLYIPYALKHRTFAMPLGKSEVGVQKKAAWNIKTRNGKFIDTKTYITGTYSNIKIPRLTLENTQYNLLLANSSEPFDSQGFPLNTKENMNLNSIRFKDGSYIQIQENYILLDLQEMNVDIEKENFDIELYEVSKDENGVESLKQLHFMSKRENVVNNILLDSEKSLEQIQDMSRIVENYFSLKVDREIDSKVYCNSLTEEERLSLVATNQLDIECKDKLDLLVNPRIVTDVRPEDIGEEC